MKKYIAILFSVMILYSCGDSSTNPVKTSFNIYFSRFNIIDDGNTFSDGNFYYKIQILDKNGNLLKDANGNNAIIETNRNSAVKAGSGESIILANSISGIQLNKQSGERFQVKAELWDKFSNGNDLLAGTQGLIYNYPWDNIPVDWYTMDLIVGSGSYQTNFVFRVEKK